MKSGFFNSNSYFINEKVNFLKFENEYKIFSEEGKEVGAVKQKLTGSEKMQRVIFDKANLPFRLDIVDNEGAIQASLVRGWSFLLSKITVLDGNGIKIGSIKQSFSLLKPHLVIFDESNCEVAEIEGDWIGWSFEITDPDGAVLGAINKQWSGLAKELFTTADNYNVTITQQVNSANRRALIVTCAITIDMILKENQ
ncbi:MAG TPA: LURP-one-related family protein [Bacteroidales bacterium]|nr:LURP-one-related family protein [Bacteroidales bacterium]HQP03279.1 LURP-one-related family protein [Bacteroidales bacterium]